MSALDRNYKVEFVKSFFPIVTTDITDSVVSIDDFKLQNNGKLSIAKFTLNAEHGDFLTNDNEGLTPLLKQFDLILITIIDDQGIAVDSKIFELTTDLTQLTDQTQYYLPLELESRERNLKGIPFSGYFRDPSLNFYEMVLKIVEAYDDNASTLFKQPLLTTYFGNIDQNEAPKFNPNIWDYSNIDNCYDALVLILNVMNLPVSAGGAGARYAINFIDDPSEANVLILRVLQQGTNNDVIPTLQQNTTYPIMKIDKVKMPSTGTQVIARGRGKSGTLYTDYDKFVSRLEFYRNIPYYNTDVIYPSGIHVRVGAQRYVSKADTPIATPPPNTTYWTAINVGNYVGDIDYSPVTNGKLNEWLNGFGNPESGFGNTDFTKIGVPDSNVVIHDQDSSDTTIGTNRELVLMRIITDDLSTDTFRKKYRASAGNTNWVEGTQVLVDSELGTISGFFVADNYGTGAGKDPNGFEYENAIVRYTEYTNISEKGYDWIVIRTPLAYDQVSVLSERKVYEWNVLFPSVKNFNYAGGDRKRGGAGVSVKWRDVSTQFYGNDCFHSPTSITQVDGLFAKKIQDGELLNKPDGTPYIQNSAIKFEYGYNALGISGEFEDVLKKIYNVLVIGTGVFAVLAGLGAGTFAKFVTPDYTSMGWWCSIPSPFPLSTHNSVTQIGSIYGGDANDINDHRYFDLFNSRRTVTGKVGYNQVDSDTLMEVTGFTLLIKFDITQAGKRIKYTGNIPFTHWAIDKEGQAWKSSKKFIRKLGETDGLTFEYGDLTPAYYGRTPIGVNNVLENILVPEIQKNKVLLKEDIILQGIQSELSYDVHGRYNPDLLENVIKPTFFNFFGGGNDDVRFSGTIDAVNWIKTPIAISNFDKTADKRIITPEVKDYPNIVNIEQLQRYANAQEQIEVFQYEQYTVEQGGIGDLSLEDSVYLFDPQMIRESDNGPNTKKLTVREIHYSVPKNQGLIRKIVLVNVIK